MKVNRDGLCWAWCWHREFEKLRQEDNDGEDFFGEYDDEDDEVSDEPGEPLVSIEQWRKM